MGTTPSLGGACSAPPGPEAVCLTSLWCLLSYAIALAGALPAIALDAPVGPLLDVGVLGRERVASMAAIRTVTHGTRGVSAQHVLLLGNRLKVDRVDTTAIPAQVVDLQAVGNGANEQLVCNPMCEARAPLPIRATHTEQGVSTHLVMRPGPRPASARRGLDNPGLEPIARRLSHVDSMQVGHAPERLLPLPGLLCGRVSHRGTTEPHVPITTTNSHPRYSVSPTV